MKVKRTSTGAALFALAGMLSLVVGLRDPEIGKDTLNYISIFSQILSGQETRYELGFVLFVRFMGFFTSDPWFIFFSIAFLFTTVYILAFRSLYTIFSYAPPRLYHYFLFIGFFLFSSWYITAVTNGLRQGLSLAFLYLSLSFLAGRKFFIFIVVFSISLSFHYSTLLIVPFLPLFFLPLWICVSVFLLLAALYFLGVNEIIVRFLSEAFSLTVYNQIVSYADKSDSWVGFSWSLFLYSAFWPIFALGLKATGWVRQEYTPLLYASLKIYTVSILPYFVFGFGPFSNRFAFIGWLLIPVMQTCILTSSRFSKSSLLSFGIILAVVGSFWFLSVFVTHD